MEAKIKSIATYYDQMYRRSHYYRYREWLYRPFVKALVAKINAKRGSRILDIGCGQGFFSRLFADRGLRPVGVDISAEAIRSAKGEYGSLGISFQTGEVLSLPYHGEFDHVFVRGLSLYNSKQFHETRYVTDALLSYLKPTGTLIFTYCSNFNSRMKSPEYIQHSYADAKKHFSSYPGAKVYFSMRVETLVFGSWAFHRPFTYLSILISRITGLGGELVAFVPCPSSRSLDKPAV